MRSNTMVIALGAALLVGLASAAVPLQKWAADLGKAAKHSVVVVGADGTVYADAGGKTFAFTPAGKPQALPAGFKLPPPAPTTGPDATVYETVEGGITALQLDGTVKWRWAPTRGLRLGAPTTRPIVGADGTVYAAGPCSFTNDAALYAVNPDGTQKWAYRIGQGVGFTSIIGAADGTAYVLTAFHELHAVAPNGTRKWVSATEEDHRISRPKAGDAWKLVTTTDVFTGELAYDVGAGGTLYVCGKDLHAFTPDGAEKWVFTVPGGASTGPVLGKDGTIYVGSGEGKLHAIQEGPNP